MALRGFGCERRSPLSSGADAGRRGYAGDGRDFIDGEVIDVRTSRRRGRRTRRPLPRAA